MPLGSRTIGARLLNSNLLKMSEILWGFLDPERPIARAACFGPDIQQEIVLGGPMRRPSAILTSVAIVCGICSATAWADLPEAKRPGPSPAAGMETGLEQLAEKTADLARSGDAAGLAGHLSSLKSEPGLSISDKERLLHQTVRAAAKLEAVSELRRQVEGLTEYQSQTEILWNEHGHTERRIAYDVGAASRHVLRVWSEGDARRYALGALERHDPRLVDRYKGAPESDRRGIETAFRRAAPAQLAIQRPHLKNGLDSGEPVAALASITAQRTEDTELMAAVLRDASVPVALRSLEGIDAYSWPGAATGLLLTAAQRPETASAALLGLGRLAINDMAARDILMDKLGGPDGSSAAAALARLDSDRVYARLRDVLLLETDEIRIRHAILALRLSESSAADAVLTEFADRPTTNPDLVAEVPAWLHD